MLYIVIALAVIIVYIQEVRIRMALNDKKDYSDLIDNYIKLHKVEDESEDDDEG